MSVASRAVNVPGSSGQLFTGPGVYKGLMIGGAAAFTVRLWDATSATGTLVAIAQLGAAGTVVDDPDAGVYFQTGLYCEVAAGSPQGCVRI